jgi:hypothetical protein
MTKSKRIQRKRTKGWRMPNNTLFVGRPTILGNPFLVKDWGQEGAVLAYRLYLKHHFAGKAIVTFIKNTHKGNDLACWCPLDTPCHADVLLEIINGEEK